MHKFVSKDPIGLAGGDVNFYAYVQNNPVNDTDPLGLYGTKQCEYYAQACKTNGGFYECNIAEKACNFFPKNDDASNCIRQCLQDKHKDRQPKNQCSDKGQTDFTNFFTDHKDCILGCMKNHNNPFDSKGPNLPDSNIRLY
jgi:hypothetical protein